MSIVSLAETLWRFLPCVIQDWAGGFVDWAMEVRSAAPPHYLQNKQTQPFLCYNIHMDWAEYTTHTLLVNITEHTLQIFSYVHVANCHNLFGGIV